MATGSHAGWHSDVWSSLYYGCAVRLLASLCFLLIISGIETNPGPGPSTRQAKISTTGELVTQKSIDDVISIEEIKGMFSSLSQQIKKSTEVLRTEIEQLRHEGSENHKIMNETVEKLKGENRLLLTKVRFLENQNRKNNLIFWGIEEISETESKEVSEQKVRQFLVNKLDIECAVSDESLQIEDIFRIGKKKTNDTGSQDMRDNGEMQQKPRGILVKFGRYKHKRIIQTAIKGKKDRISTVRISEDYSSEVREARKALMCFSDELKLKNPDCKTLLLFDSLKVGSDIYRFKASDKSIFCTNGPQVASPDQ
ncbi:hypothetical protein SNE40_010776 [Patella caerulea]|uniref:Uncharacterized protein n=1 Tax=Patella caerulea TaxID=87958 RepID=A0AAN8JV39_PATCE